MVTSKYFSEAEFQRCSPACGLQDMDADFMSWLDKVREKAGIPLKLTSAYRSQKHEIQQGRSGNSAHTERKAVDIATPDSVTRFKIINAALELGCKRIGINFEKNFVHIDTSKRLDQNVIWKY